MPGQCWGMRRTRGNRVRFKVFRLHHFWKRPGWIQWFSNYALSTSCTLTTERYFKCTIGKRLRAAPVSSLHIRHYQ